MGGGSSNQSTTVISNEIINENTMNILNESVNKQKLETISQQNMSLKGIKALSCRMPITQSMDVTVKMMQNFEASDSADLVSDIMAGLDSAVQEEASSEGGYGDVLSGGSENDSYTEIRNNIHNKVEKNITNTFLNEQAAKIVNTQGLVLEDITMDPLFFELNARMGVALTLEERRLAATIECPITQDMQINFVGEQVGKKISEIINSDKAATDLKADLEKKSSSKTQGVGEAVADAAEGIGAGVGTAAEGVGAGVGGAAQGIGMGAAAAMAGPFIPSAISSSSMMAAGMVMMMMSKGGGGPDPAAMAAMMRK
jgi:hypothetical protein